MPPYMHSRYIPGYTDIPETLKDAAFQFCPEASLLLLSSFPLDLDNISPW